MIVNELDMNCERVWTIITKGLGMRKICAKMVPKLLKEEQNERHVLGCHDILEQFEIDPNLGKIIHRRRGMDLGVQSGDQAPDSSVEWSDTAEAAESEDSQIQSQGDVDCFLWCEGIVPAEVLAQGHTINQHIYKEVLRRLMRSV